MNRITVGLVIAGLLAMSARAHANDTVTAPVRSARPLVTSYAQDFQNRSRAVASDAKHEQVKASSGGKSLALVWTVVGTAASLAATAYYVKTMQKTTEGAPKAR